MTFGNYLKQLRKHHQLTQLQLAEQSGVSKSYLSFLESGKRHPSRDVVLKLSDLLCETPQQTHELFQLAGFSFELKVNETSTQPLTDTLNFESYLKHVLHLIKQGQLPLAQTKIENGFARFQKPAQMQTLLAHLELSKGHFKSAIVSQKAAIEQYNLTQAEQGKGLSLADFHNNLGVMYFLQGDHFLFQMQAEENDLQKKKKHCTEAINEYNLALEAFNAALICAPENMYILDELARVNLNLADISQSNKETYLKTAIEALEKVVSHPEKSQLGIEHIYESTAFLGHAYSQIKNFKQAQTILSLLTSFFPKKALAFYLEACYYSLSFEDSKNSEDIQKSQLYFKKAMDLDRAYLYQATLDKETSLKTLYKHSPHIFNEEHSE